MAGKSTGRKRRPIEARILEGTFRKDRHSAAPAVVGSFPKAPNCVSEAERALWEAFPHVVWIGESDRVAVHAAVSVYERILRNQAAQRETETSGYPLTFKHVIKHTIDEKGQPVELEIVTPEENPLITQEIKLWGRLMSILATLGLTPADRAKMSAPKGGQPANKWAGLL